MPKALLHHCTLRPRQQVLSFGGFALFCGLWNLWVPALMGVGMARFSVPELDFYLRHRYQEQWRRYVATVRWSMVPLLW